MRVLAPEIKIVTLNTVNCWSLLQNKGFEETCTSPHSELPQHRDPQSSTASVKLVMSPPIIVPRMRRT
jgi:hypothetical protein